MIEGVLPMLKPFFEITTEVSAENNFTLSKVIIMASLLQKSIANSIPNNEVLKEVVEKLREAMIVRFGDLENNIFYAESTILDPRFKKRGLKSEECFQEVVAAQKDKTSPTKCGIWDEYDKQFNQGKKQSNNADDAMIEFHSSPEETDGSVREITQVLLVHIKLDRREVQIPLLVLPNMLGQVIVNIDFLCAIETMIQYGTTLMVPPGVVTGGSVTEGYLIISPPASDQ
ncbi:uncharacterized protein LOC121404912 [Drosophila obscura]|uniref:uncharacterized protein LOC121404912 n=1 Tax=Drosophila obscura TaxID=7282 RepID=UPI001BB1E23A|nr:uncharacterized protein LOC121404912 [Drosophila obscura]